MERVIILGGGFGGLAACRSLRRSGVSITLLDRQNHHVFQPLLYQVATAGLGATDIAQPVRSILSRQRNVTVRMADVTAVDLGARQVHVRERDEPADYDWLVMAIGVETNYFGHDEWAAHAPGLKSLHDAARIRARVLHAFERAENTEDAAERRRLLTSVVIGGGPTGVEMAGALIELARLSLRRDFRRIDPGEARVVLVEGGDRILSAFDERLSARAERALTEMGVEVQTGVQVEHIGAGPTVTYGGWNVAAGNVIWAAGVRAPAITRTLGVPLGPGGRVIVGADGSLPEHPEVFAIGDMAQWIDQSGVEVPALAQGAMQTGRYVAKLIAHEVVHDRRPPEDRPRFGYRDKGIMATIGRKRAVVQTKRLRFDGQLAWHAWLFIHLIVLIDLRSKIAVFVQWVYAYVTFRPGARLIYRFEPVARVDDDGPVEPSDDLIESGAARTPGESSRPPR